MSADRVCVRLWPVHTTFPGSCQFVVIVSSVRLCVWRSMTKVKLILLATLIVIQSLNVHIARLDSGSLKSAATLTTQVTPYILCCLTVFVPCAVLCFCVVIGSFSATSLIRLVAQRMLRESFH